MMNTKFLGILLFFLIGSQFHVKAQNSYEIPQGVKRILFIGNSITYSGQYVSYIDAYFTLRYPDRDFEIINVGLPSETVSGLSEQGHADGKFPRPDLHERLERIISQVKPDLVLACYGMNDGIYLPFDEGRFQKYKEGILWLNNQVVESGASIVHMTPPIYDERMGEAYANVLDIYADWLISKRYTDQWEVIDLHWPMKKYLEDKRLTDNNYFLAKDGVHPNDTGHWIMAQQLLLYLGEGEVSKANGIEEVVSQFHHGEEIWKLVEERQKMMKDAWLTSIGHQRPGMNVGLTLGEALDKKEILRKEIRNLQRK
ncbi:MULTISPECIES: SGNH/GDSL hydrolase family protein [Arenibacter]|uniref:SGNH/GDSL hydrolase family protein n=1 Tax=Arenibacter TaxID=178469 RepID=UPI001C0666DE|nr:MULTISPECIES: SGNH/GDSL hydrolase family protein [Arenibacter]MBU2904236.1 SGNH/GDSL hydrolase family protein [Arenibacter algicola]MCK0134754.1 SGNH/GDSL hydrolase family protein [Arenibacter sp. S6351L]